MSPPIRPTFPSTDERFDFVRCDDGSLTLFEKQTGETFHSGCGAYSECEHVYLRNSGVAARLESNEPTRVLEVGLGTGLAFAITAELATAKQTSLEYVAVDRRPLNADIISTIIEAGLTLLAKPSASWSDRLSDFVSRYQSLVATVPSERPSTASHPAHNSYSENQLGTDRNSGTRHPEVSDAWVITWSQFATLRLLPYDLLHTPLSRLLGGVNFGGDLLRPAFDAIYYDPFSPATNPWAWTSESLRGLPGLMKPTGRVVSYCVNVQARRAFESVGFVVTRVKGPPGGKREVLVASPALKCQRDGEQ